MSCFSFEMIIRPIIVITSHLFAGSIPLSPFVYHNCITSPPTNLLSIVNTSSLRISLLFPSPFHKPSAFVFCKSSVSDNSQYFSLPNIIATSPLVAFLSLSFQLVIHLATQALNAISSLFCFSMLVSSLVVIDISVKRAFISSYDSSKCQSPRNIQKLSLIIHTLLLSLHPTRAKKCHGQLLIIAFFVLAFAIATLSILLDHVIRGPTSYILFFIR